MSTDISGIIGGIGAGIQGIAGMTGAIINGVQTKRALEMQKKMYNEQFEYAREQDLLMQQREDTAIQRRMADLASAGINPLLAGAQNGAGATAGGTVSGMFTPVQSNVGNIIAEMGKNVGNTVQGIRGYQQQDKSLQMQATLTKSQKNYLEAQTADVKQWIMDEKQAENYWDTWQKTNEYEKWEIAKFIEQVENEAIGYIEKYAEKDDKEAKEIIADYKKGNTVRATKKAFRLMNQKEGYNEAAKNIAEKIEFGFKDSAGKQVGGKVLDFVQGVAGGGAQQAFNYMRENRLERANDWRYANHNGRR